ncbi:MAG: UDP-N-acetylglucosamine 2-epimerase (non-hydrolyzing) [bacterium]
MKSRRIVSIVGARPQFIKAAPVSRALRAEFEETLVHTGQHYDADMSRIFFDELRIPSPDVNLGVGGGSRLDQIGRMLVEIEKFIAGAEPAIVLVYGDTNSTLAGALAASDLQVPIAHVEAGLRSYNLSMPEEVNRVLCDHMSSLLFCPTQKAVGNLAKEGITKGVFLVGDVMRDALMFNLTLAVERSKVLERIGARKDDYILATVHRAGNTDDPGRLGAILEAFGGLSKPVILPLHPRTRRVIAETGLSLDGNIRVLDPVGYLDMLVLEQNADCILTDSGGIQKEAYMLGTRCITLREETEWVETVESGWNKLVGVVPEEIRGAVENWHPSGERPAFYGDGRAAEHIRDILLDAV